MTHPLPKEFWATRFKTRSGFGRGSKYKRKHFKRGMELMSFFFIQRDQGNIIYELFLALAWARVNAVLRIGIVVCRQGVTYTMHGDFFEI